MIIGKLIPASTGLQAVPRRWPSRRPTSRPPSCAADAAQAQLAGAVAVADGRRSSTSTPKPGAEEPLLPDEAGE